LNKEAEKKATEKTGGVGEKVTEKKVKEAVENSELCVASSDCDKEKEGVKYECGATGLALKMFGAAITIALSLD